MDNASSKLNTVIKALPLVVLDIMSTFAAFVVGTWGMSLEAEIFGMNAFGWHVALLAVLYVAVLAAFRMYTTIWKYASVNELVRIVLAVTVASVVGDVVSALVFGERLWIRSYLFAWLFMLVACGASRFAIRIMAGAKGWSPFGNHDIKTLMIYQLMLLCALKTHPGKPCNSYSTLAKRVNKAQIQMATFLQAKSSCVESMRVVLASCHKSALYLLNDAWLSAKPVPGAGNAFSMPNSALCEVHLQNTLMEVAG